MTYTTLFRRLLRNWSLLPAPSIADMPLLDIADVPLLVFFPRQAWTIMSSLRALRQNLRVKRWASLSVLYPRPIMWMYIYELFFWARYCDKLPALVAQPDKALLAEMFIRYICQMDVYLDSFDSRKLLIETPQQIKRRPEVRAIGYELCMHLEALNLPAETKRRVLRMIVCYRRNYLQALRRWACAGSYAVYPLAQVVEDKERVAGDLHRIWCLILCEVYEVNPQRAQEIGDIFFNLWMAIQVVDDLADLVEDHGIAAQNLALAVIHNSPQEWLALQDHLKTQPAFSWMKKCLNASYRSLFQMHERYTNTLLTQRHQPALTREIHNLVRTMDRFAQL